MMIPEQLIDLARVADIDLTGRGGREKRIDDLLPEWKRVGAPLYDYEAEHAGVPYRLEVKKQQNFQWFDSGKYYRLSETNRNIRVMFLLHDKGRITHILVVCLGDLIDYLCEYYKKDGWTDEVMKIAADFKLSYPSLQFKARAPIKTIFEKNRELFEVHYENLK